MLVEFSVGNYRSFKDKVILSMEAANISSLPKSLDEQNLFSINDDLRLLTSAALYGANASGKSNLIKALAFMRYLVLSSSRETQIEERIDVEPFLLSREHSGPPSFFEIVFIVDGEQYRYGFEVTAQQVIAEWLYKLGSLRELTLFKRDGDDLSVNQRNFREGRGLETRTRPNALFLSVSAQFNGTISTRILKWFRLMSVNPGIDDTDEMDLAIYGFETSPHRNAIEQLIKRLDVSIESLDFERISAPPEALPKEWAQKLTKFFDPTFSSGSSLTRVGIKTYHNVFDSQGQSVGKRAFDLEEQESAGTRRLFALAYPLVRALKEGSVLVIDELDARLHPNLTIELIRLFHSEETNPLHAQLLFTTHNTNLLSADLFRRDQIWFVEKSRQGASELYSLVEYRLEGNKIVRNDASFEKDYIAGRYGAIPFPGDFSDFLGANIEKTTTPV